MNARPLPASTLTGMDYGIDDIWYLSPGQAMHFDRDGQPLTLRRFGELFGDPAYKILRTSKVAGRSVITAWLGVDQGSLFDPGPPLIFGTIVKQDGEFLDGSERCEATEAEALANHDAVVASFTSGTE